MDACAWPQATRLWFFKAARLLDYRHEDVRTVPCSYGAWARSSRQALVLLVFELRKQRIDGLIHRFPANVLEANDALLVEYVDRRPAEDIPSS
ncbi:MAG: hypothetical protein ACI91B_003365 [Planctomycetota bacterium]|jgi:hypothetical protein